MKKYLVKVTQIVEVELDETLFTEEFMEEFRESFCPFYDIEEHACHLGQAYARGLIDYFDAFIEGYGPQSEMGISFREVGFDKEIVE